MLSGNRLVELVDGRVEVLPTPTDFHQAVVAFIYEMMAAFIRSRNLGTIRFAPLRVRMADGHFRMPDVQFISTAKDASRHDEYWDTADLVVEVVSEDDRSRDLETKRFEYAEAGLPEYWIVDPIKLEVIVLKLVGNRYEEHGVFTAGQRATSVVLGGFVVEVDQVFSAK